MQVVLNRKHGPHGTSPVQAFFFSLQESQALVTLLRVLRFRRGVDKILLALVGESVPFIAGIRVLYTVRQADFDEPQIRRPL